MGMIGRISDAIHALKGRPNPNYVRWSDLEEIETRLLDWELRFDNVFEKLKTWSARMNKRQSREAAKLVEHITPSEPTSPPQMQEIASQAANLKARKQQLRRRAFSGSALPLGEANGHGAAAAEQESDP